VLLALGVMMLATLLVMTTLLLRRAPASSSPVDAAVENGTRVIGSPQRPYRLITATSGFETYPTLSPDGSLVAYEGANEDGNGGGAIKVQTSGNAPAPAAGAAGRPVDRFPSWSPDGREIALHGFRRRRLPGADRQRHRRRVRQATRCDGTELLSFDWTPDGRGLVFGSMVGRYAHRGIRVLDLASGQWRALATASTRMTSTTRRATRPTGKWLVFVRNPQLGDLWRMPAAGGTPEQLTNEAAELRGWAWLDDGRTIVFGRRVDSEARLYYLDVERRTLRDAGLDDAQWPAVSRRGGMLAFVHRRAVRRVQGADAGRRARAPVCVQWPRWAADGGARRPPAGLHLRSLRLRAVVGGHAAARFAAPHRRPAAGSGRHRTGRPTAASCWWSAATRMGARWSTRSRHAMNACNLCRFRPNSRCRPCTARRRSSCWWSSAMPTSAPG
jgi:hypothetical protein